MNLAVNILSKEFEDGKLFNMADGRVITMMSPQFNL
jgi:hypothetical protein